MQELDFGCDEDAELPDPFMQGYDAGIHEGLRVVRDAIRGARLGCSPDLRDLENELLSLLDE